MHGPELLIPLMGIVAVFSIPVTAIWTSHRQKMMEMQMRAQNQGNSNVVAEMNALRDEVRALRDTTMQYDLSFDTALQRMEQRMEGMERRVQQIETNPTAELRTGR